MLRPLYLVPFLLLACAEPVRVVEPTADPGQVGAGQVQRRVQDLAPGDILVVHYHSTGCFHDFAATISLLGTDLGVAMTTTVAAEGDLPALTTTRFLSTEELAALDAELEAVRGPANGWCTTQTSYRLDWTRGRETVTDSIHDAGCVLLADDVIERRTVPALTFGRLAWAADSTRWARRVPATAGE